MNLQLQNKNALVTGSTKGIGSQRALPSRLANSSATGSSFG
jgi:NAD(P)-dependent dehydrogenase (short-subunit alcohol dehydrogenase family)